MFHCFAIVSAEKCPCEKKNVFKGTQVGPLLVLVCHCFRENVIVTCKIVSFLRSLDNFLLKMLLCVCVFLFAFFFDCLFVCFEINFKMELM